MKDDIKKILAGISIFSLVGGLSLLNASTPLNNNKIVIAKSGWSGWGGKSENAGSIKKKSKDNKTDNETKKSMMKKENDESSGWG